MGFVENRDDPRKNEKLNKYIREKEVTPHQPEALHPPYMYSRPKETMSNKELDEVIKRAKGDKSPLQESKYLTVAEFVKRFASALEEELEESNGREESNIIDLACQTSMFSESFIHIVNNFI